MKKLYGLSILTLCLLIDSTVLKADKLFKLLNDTDEPISVYLQSKHKTTSSSPTHHARTTLPILPHERGVWKYDSNHGGLQIVDITDAQGNLYSLKNINQTVTSYWYKGSQTLQAELFGHANKVTWATVAPQDYVYIPKNNKY